MRLLCEALGGTTRVTIWNDAAGGLFVSGPEVEQAIQAEMQRDLTVLKHLLEAWGGGQHHLAHGEKMVSGYCQPKQISRVPAPKV